MAEIPNGSSTASIISAIAALLSAISWPIIVAIVIYNVISGSDNLLTRLNEFMRNKQSAEFAIGPTGLSGKLVAADASAKAVGDMVAKSQNAPLSSKQKEEITATARSTVTQLNEVVFDPARRLKILWVDDHPENNIDLQYAFQAIGIIVVTVDSNELINRAFHSASGFDLVITDMGRDAVEQRRATQPEGGLETISIIRKEYPEVPVIVFASSYAEKHANDVLESPIIKITNRPQEVYALVTTYAKKKAENPPS